MNGIRLRQGWLTIGYAMIIVLVWLSLTDVPAVVPHVAGFDKFEHALAYGALMWWFGQAWTGAWQRFKCLFGLNSLSLLLEVAQAGTTYRVTEIADAAAALGGTLLAILILRCGGDRALSRLISSLGYEPSTHVSKHE